MNQHTVIYHSVPDSLFQKMMQMVAKVDELHADYEHMKQQLDILNNAGVEKEAYSVKETAIKIGKSQSHVKKLFKEGHLEGMQEGYGKPIYIYPESIKAYLNQGREFTLNLQAS